MLRQSVVRVVTIPLELPVDILSFVCFHMNILVYCGASRSEVLMPLLGVVRVVAIALEANLA